MLVGGHSSVYHATARMWQKTEVGLSLYYVGSWVQTLVAKHDNTSPNPLSYLICSAFFFF